MTGRDRMVLMIIACVVVLGAVWIEAVSPERKQASQLAVQVSAAQAQLASAEGNVASARQAQSQYAAAYASVVSLGKAVPPTQEVPALIDELTQASSEKNVEFASITNSGGASSSATAAASGASASGAAGGFTQVPFTFTFEGSYFSLEHLFNKLTDFAVPGASGSIQVSGRLLTIQSVKLTPASTAPGHTGAEKLVGSITATAYTLPASQGLTGSASPASPTSAPAAASTAAATSSPAPPAIVQVTR
jgi:Tfp pilus assembly protein PilO